jgi:ribosomal protein S18 acetylase RimI-like enzyme
MAIEAKLDDLDIREGLEGLTPERITTLYRRAPLHRSVGARENVWRMFESASLVLTAWHQGHLVGIARVLSDGVVYSYLCDLAVEPDVQRLGVGRRLIDAVLERCKGTELILRDSDISAGFYERIGFRKAENAWIKRA